jgi:hypothetical protein
MSSAGITVLAPSPYHDYAYAIQSTVDNIGMFSINTGASNSIYNPFGRFQGIINNISINETWSGQQASNTIGLICRSAVGMLQMKVAGRRTSPDDEKKYFPNDLAMDHVPSIANANLNFGAPPIS